jgi:hypothetical protein
MKFLFPSLLLVFGFVGCGANNDETENKVIISCLPTQIEVDFEKSTTPLYVTTEGEWMVYSNDSWINCEKHAGESSIGNATITVNSNTSASEREGNVVVKSGTTRFTIPVIQSGKPQTPIDPSIIVPEGYQLVWNDEFNEPRTAAGKPEMPNNDHWWYETGASGWGNNEIQNYVKGFKNTDTCALIYDGTLKIVLKKVGSEVLSVRMNTKESWTYGYFEARIKMPVGKGTWPAFWMMPKNFTAWPKDGEIDIVEAVGYNPGYVHSSIHCTAYNHSINTEKTAKKQVSTSASQFHVYAVEWTADYIKGYVDGVNYFTFSNDKANNYDTWPFYNPFYLKLNMAWGGNWGGAQGIDETALPATFEIDYVRVFQKK